jgi:hypothetical protein
MFKSMNSGTSSSQTIQREHVEIQFQVDDRWFLPLSFLVLAVLFFPPPSPLPLTLRAQSVNCHSVSPLSLRSSRASAAMMHPSVAHLRARALAVAAGAPPAAAAELS